MFFCTTVAKELEEAELNKQREAAISRLTDYELKLLGVRKWPIYMNSFPKY